MEETRVDRLSREEHAIWQELCAALLAVGAVTHDDLGSQVSDNDTPGQRLLNTIRHWGARYADLFVAATKAKE